MNKIPADATRIECGSYTSANSYVIDPNADQPIVGGYIGGPSGDVSVKNALKPQFP